MWFNFAFTLLSTISISMVKWSLTSGNLNFLKSPTFGNWITLKRNHRSRFTMRFIEANQERCKWIHQNFESWHHKTYHHRCRRKSALNSASSPNSLRVKSRVSLIMQNVPYVFVESKKALGKACGTSRNVICVSILKNEKSSMNDEIQRIKE